MSKEKEIEFLKENVINIIDDNFTLNIDYYINNKSLDFFQKVFNIKKETKNYKKIKVKTPINRLTIKRNINL